MPDSSCMTHSFLHQLGVPPGRDHIFPSMSAPAAAPPSAGETMRTLEGNWDNLRTRGTFLSATLTWPPQAPNLYQFASFTKKATFSLQMRKQRPREHPMFKMYIHRAPSPAARRDLKSKEPELVHPEQGGDPYCTKSSKAATWPGKTVLPVATSKLSI